MVKRRLCQDTRNRRNGHNFLDTGCRHIQENRIGFEVNAEMVRTFDFYKEEWELATICIFLVARRRIAFQLKGKFGGSNHEDIVNSHGWNLFVVYFSSSNGRPS